MIFNFSLVFHINFVKNLRNFDIEKFYILLYNYIRNSSEAEFISTFFVVTAKALLTASA